MRCPSGRCRRFDRGCARRRARTLAVVSRSSCRPSGTLYLNRKKSPTLRRGLPHETCLLLQLAPDLLEEPGCTNCQGSDPHIAWFGAAEASVFPETTPSPPILFFFGIKKIFQIWNVISL